jgi:outer membrane immunogenic protein
VLGPGGPSMNKTSVCIAAIATLIETRTFAADLAVKAPEFAPSVPAWDWTGFYVGGDIGAKWMRDKWTATSLFDGAGPAPGFTALPIDASSPTIYDTWSFRAGGYVGYNWQFSPTWVGGVEGDAAWANDSQTQFGFPGCATRPTATCVAGTVAAPNGLPFGGDTTSVKTLWDASVRGRLGYLITPDLLLYGTGGVAFQRIDVFGQCGPYFSSALCFTSGGNTVAPGITQSETLVGWTAGVGLEHHVWGNWLLRAEYRFADFGSWNTHFAFLPPAPGVGNNTYRFSNAVDTNIVKIGLAYKF